MNMQDVFIERARLLKKTIVLPEGSDIRTLQAAAILANEKIVSVKMLGKEAEIQQMAEIHAIDLAGVEIIDPVSNARREEYARMLVDLRAHKGMNREKADMLINDPLVSGVMMVKADDADGMVAGAINATADVLRPSLQIIKTAPDVKIVSSFFVMIVPDCTYGHNGGFIFADCGLVQNPTAEQLAHIAVNSARSFKNLLGAEPVVGMLSHSTKGSSTHPDVEKVIEATKIAHDLDPHLDIDGELQLDAAVDPTVASSKAPESSVAGRCNVLVFPDLDSGNIGYKLAQRLAGAKAYGPVTQGLAKPVNDLSRGCTAEDIVGVAAITAIQAEKHE